MQDTCISPLMSSGLFLQLTSVHRFGLVLAGIDFATLRIFPPSSSATETHCEQYPVYRDICSQLTIHAYKSYQFGIQTEK